MESELRVSARPELTRPVLVAAFRGWNDGAQAASLAAGYLARLWGADQIADLDPEGFFDFQATRPHVSLVDVLADACNKAGIPSASLWAAVPHYVSLTPSPRAASALCERLGGMLGVEIDTAELDEAAETYEEQVSQAVASDEETAAYVEELEHRADTVEDDFELPSGDALAAELTRYLREREAGNGEPGPRGPAS